MQSPLRYGSLTRRVNAFSVCCLGFSRRTLDDVSSWMKAAIALACSSYRNTATLLLIDRCVSYRLAGRRPLQ